MIAVDNRDDPLMAEELFGPLLPVLELNDVQTTLADIRRGPKPLALYMFERANRSRHWPWRPPAPVGSVSTT